MRAQPGGGHQETLWLAQQTLVILYLSPTLPNLTLAGMSVLLKLIAWTAGTEVATNVVVTKVLAQGLGILLNGVLLGSTFIKVWKRFRKD